MIRAYHHIRQQSRSLISFQIYLTRWGPVKYAMSSLILREPSSKMAVLWIIMSVFSLAFANPPQKLIAPLGNTKFGANIQSASANANGVFNAIHSSMVCRSLNESSWSLFHPVGFESFMGS